nr:hypothetical protein [Phycicoccus sp. HDW14]
MEDLRQLVGARGPHPAARGDDPGVALGRELGAALGLGVEAHGAELHHLEGLSPDPDAGLPEEQRPPRDDELVQRGAAEQQQPDRRGEDDEQQVEQPLEVPLRGRHRLRHEEDEGQAGHLAQAVEAEEGLAAADP